jgi:Heterokaryon incompatibility protein (HET)
MKVSLITSHELKGSYELRQVLGNDHSSPFVQRQRQCTDVANEYAINQARQWLEECQNNHSKCPGKKIPYLPSRVIDVGAETTFSHLKLQINKSNTRARYTALSYCWGGPQSITTTKATLSAHLISLSFKTLPRTIQDAVKTTQNLGIRFLWVDALCIIQDCDVDKAQEINNMGNIYSYATLTISAANAKAACDGFLGSRPRIPSCEIPIYHPTSRGTQPREWMEGASQQKVWLTATIKSSDSDEPLYTRGWTLQERLLSSRMLLYGRKELTWQCQQSSTESVGTTFYRRSTGCMRLPVGIFVTKS